MNLRAFMGVAIFAITTVAAFAQDEPNNQAPKPTLADVQHLAEAISGDKAKLRAYCELGELHDQTQQALEEQDAKAIDTLIAKADDLEQRLGPEYDKVIEGLDQIDLSSAEGQEIADVFKTLQAKCE
jgi:flagellar motility protein MotE (MotC chaperone)